MMTVTKTIIDVLLVIIVITVIIIMTLTRVFSRFEGTEKSNYCLITGSFVFSLKNWNFEFVV